MESTLWLLLVFITSSVSSAETDKILLPYSKPETSFQFADSIYYTQRNCDNIVEEAISKALNEGGSFKQPLPDGKYLQCKESLDYQKREFIKSYLEGLGYYLHSFPLVRSNGAHIKLAAPADETLPEDKTDFDIHQEICVANQVCLELVRSKFSKYDAEDIKEKEKSVARCLAFLDDLKVRFVKEKKLDETALRKEGRGLNLVCTNGEFTLGLPKKTVSAVLPTKSEDTVVHEEETVENPSDIQNPLFSDHQENLDSGNEVITAPSSSKPVTDGNKNTYESLYDRVVEQIKSTFTRKPNAELSNIQMQSDSENSKVFPGTSSPELLKDVKDAIKLMERDCEELLEWGEQPTMMVSVLKQLYDECVQGLDRAKRAFDNTN